MRKKLLFVPTVLAMSMSSALFADTVFDLKVSYYDTYDNAIARQDSINNNLKNMAEAIYEATNGAHRIGKVTVYTDGGSKDNTDILWVASCWPNANISGLGKPGARIEHCDTFPNGGSPLSFLGKPRAGGYTLTHEWGHFTYALYDEYQNSDNQCGVDAGNPCKDDVGVTNSVMNSHWGAVNTADDSVADLNWLNFSTKLNNDGATIQTTAQARIYKASNWDTLVRAPDQDPTPQGRKQYLDLVAVAPAAGQVPTIEINTPENQTKAKEKFSIEFKRGGGGDTTPKSSRAGVTSASKVPMVKMIVIDQSANVHARQLAEVKAAVAQFIEESELNDVIGVVSFSHQAQILSAPTLIDSEAAKKKLIQLIKGITATNQSPALGVALQTAHDAIKAANPRQEYEQEIYLFANGFNATGVAPATVIPTLKTAGISVYSFALNEPTEGFLRTLSEQTGGKAWFAPTSDTLETALRNLELASSPMVDVIVATANKVAITSTKDFSFYVDDALGELELSVNYDGAADIASFKLLDPSGTARALTMDDCVSDDAMDSGVQQNSCVINLSNPAVGNWTFQATSTNNAVISYAVKALPKDNGTVFFASVNANPSLAMQNKTVIVEAHVAQDFPLTAINATGTVQKPDGNTDTLMLRDDGVAPDKLAGDGVYTANLATPQLGQYTVTVSLDNKAGKGQASDSGTSYAPSTTGKVPNRTLTPVTDKFERVAQTQVLVKATLTDYQRAMNWAEAVYPGILTALDKQESDITYQGKTFKVRYYPLAKTYLGYNPDDQRMYVYNPAMFGANPLQLDALATYLPQAQQAGF